MSNITNTQLMNAIHELDKKLVEHIGLIENHTLRMVALEDDVYRGEDGGIKFKNKTMWTERGEKKKMTSEIKIAIILSVVNGLLATGNMLRIF